jgi:hypothetical protein
MKIETTYSHYDLTNGKCPCCGEYSYEILLGDGRCIDCIEDETFFERTMRNSPRIGNHRSPFDIGS